MSSETTLGLDIGGANLKAANSNRLARSDPFALWRHPDELPAAIARLIAHFPRPKSVALTMTGELCDCFRTKRDGVLHILAAVRAALPARIRPRVWGVDGAFHTPGEVADRPHLVAAANWQALATFAARLAPEGGYLLDIGSTTTDVVRLGPGGVVATGLTDPDRLSTGELVYTGVRRTPLCALLPPGRFAAELFATTHDLWLLAGDLPERPDDADTADGRGATRELARERAARMLGADGETVVAADLARLLAVARRTQERLILTALTRLRVAGTAVVGGSGEFLASRLAQRHRGTQRVIRLSTELGPDVAEAAPAYAVAVLAGERP